MLRVAVEIEHALLLEVALDAGLLDHLLRALEAVERQLELRQGVGVLPGPGAVAQEVEPPDVEPGVDGEA